MKEQDVLLSNINQIHTTILGEERIRRNLDLGREDAVAYCKKQICNKDARIDKRGKNYYCMYRAVIITVNSFSYTIITAHRIK